MARNPLQRPTLATACMIALIPGMAAAASFQILEQSPALQGTSFAGTASSAQDASTVFFNPAAMTQLDGAHYTAGGNLIFAEAEFNDDGSNTSGPDATTDETGFVPNFYYVRPLNEKWTFGFGVNAPFGLASSYDEDWKGRYHATDSELQLLNINPTFAYRASEKLSLGIGLNYQLIDATLENEVDSFAACVGAGGDPTTQCGPQHGGLSNRASDSSAKVEGDDDVFTIDLSVLFQVNDATRIGAVFRQGGDFTLEGDAQFEKDDSCDPTQTGALAGFCSGALDSLAGDIVADVDIPDTFTVSVSHILDDRWTLHGDIAWTKWSSINQIEINKESDGTNVSTLELEYDDTMRYAFGAEYRDGGPWTWRGGIALDEAPQTDPEFQTPRVPDEDRTWLSVGFNYRFSPSSSLDFGFTHIVVDDPKIDNTDAAGHQLKGSYDAAVDIIALQGNWTF